MHLLAYCRREDKRGGCYSLQVAVVRRSGLSYIPLVYKASKHLNATNKLICKEMKQNSIH